MSTNLIVPSDIVRRERACPVGMVELYTRPMMAPRYDRRGVIVRITATSVELLVEPKEGETEAERADVTARLGVDRDLVLTVRLLELV